jgi:hypothetical protein
VTLDDGRRRAEAADGKAGLKQRQADLIRLLQPNSTRPPATCSDRFDQLVYPFVDAMKTTGRELLPPRHRNQTDLHTDAGGDGLGCADIETGVSRIGRCGLARFHRVQRHHRLIAHFERTLANLAE